MSSFDIQREHGDDVNNVLETYTTQRSRTLSLSRIHHDTTCVGDEFSSSTNHDRHKTIARLSFKVEIIFGLNQFASIDSFLFSNCFPSRPIKSLNCLKMTKHLFKYRKKKLSTFFDMLTNSKPITMSFRGVFVLKFYETFFSRSPSKLSTKRNSMPATYRRFIVKLKS